MAVHGPGLYLAAFAAALAVSTVASLAGVYGAVLVPPLPDLSRYSQPWGYTHEPLYNVVATRGALYRYWRQGQTGGRLTALLLGGTIPGVVAGVGHPSGASPGPRGLRWS